MAQLVAHPTPDRAVGSSILSGLTLFYKLLIYNHNHTLIFIIKLLKTTIIMGSLISKQPKPVVNNPQAPNILQMQY